MMFKKKLTSDFILKKENSFKTLSFTKINRNLANQIFIQNEYCFIYQMK